MSEKLFNAGVYTGVGIGFEYKLKAEVTVSENEITNIEFLGEFGELATQTHEEMKSKILAEQTEDVDAVSGASFSSRAVFQAVGDALEQARVEATAGKEPVKINGSYEGAAAAFEGHITVKVNFSDDEMIDIEYVEENESAAIGEYALDSMPKRILDAQSLAVDSISGATVTSVAIKTAVENAIRSAGGRIADFHKEVAVEAVDETFDYDVVVVGAGLSGLVAAIAAKEEGNSVALIEKVDIIGGSGAMSSGNMIVADADDRVPAMVQAWFERTKIQNVNPMNREKVETMAAASPSVIKIFKDSGVEFNVEESDTGAQTFKVKPNERSIRNAKSINIPSKNANTKGGSDLLMKVEKFARAQDVDFYLGCPMTELLSDDNGAAVGVVSETKYGKKTFNAKAVILASGDYAHNHKMAEKYAPEANYEYTASSIGNAGDGHLAALELGAQMTEFQDSMSGVFNANPYDRGEVGDPTNDYPFEALVVDMDGKRRFKEDGNSHEQKFHFKRPVGRNTAWVIMDSKIGTKFFDLDEFVERTAKGDQIIQAFKADTIEELAAKIEVPAKTLTGEVERYNKLVAQGEDTDQGKDAKFLEAVEIGPFYGVLLYDGTRGIYGGIQSSKDAEVLNANGEPIPGLYASGVISSGDYLADYYAGRQALTLASHMGYIAGKTASKKI